MGTVIVGINTPRSQKSAPIVWHHLVFCSSTYMPS